VLEAVLIVGVPFALSLAWFAFWVIRLRQAARDARAKAQRKAEPTDAAENVPPQHREKD
jgi:hypothetical protein